MRKNCLKYLSGFVLLLGLTTSCNQTVEKTKNAMKKAGKTAGALPEWNEVETKN